VSERLLTAVELAELLSVPESWVREATRAGRLPHLALGRYRRYSRPTIEAWLEKQQAGPPAGPIRLDASAESSLE
jgi:excisionase family DNA binding protein